MPMADTSEATGQATAASEAVPPVHPERFPAAGRPTRGDILPHHLGRFIPDISNLAHMAGFAPPEPEAYRKPGGRALFDMVFRAAVVGFADAPPPMFAVQDVAGIVGGLPPLRLDRFADDFSLQPSAHPTDTLALGIEIKAGSWAILIPIAPGIESVTAEAIVQTLHGREADFVDLDFFEAQLRISENEQSGIETCWVIAPPAEFGRFFLEQEMPAATMFLLRRAGAWDRLRAEYAATEPHWMPPLEADRFAEILESSLPYDPARIEALFADVLVELAKLPPNTTDRWETGVATIFEMFEPFARRLPEKLAVVVPVIRYEPGDADDFIEVARLIVAIGFGLDLNQARALHAAADANPRQFVVMMEGDNFFESSDPPQIMPTILMSRAAASIERRSKIGFDRFAAEINDRAASATGVNSAR